MRKSVGLAMVLGIAVFVAANARATRGTSGMQAPAAADATKRIVASAQAFLSTLDEARRAKVVFPFGSEQKARWSNARALEI
jgi:hypothetical protein